MWLKSEQPVHQRRPALALQGSGGSVSKSNVCTACRNVDGHTRICPARAAPSRRAATLTVSQCVLDVVVGGAWCTEHCHDLVADELVDGAAIALDQGNEPFEQALDDVGDRLGIQSFRRLGESRNVGEKHADDLVLGWSLERCRGLCAFVERSELRAKRSERGIDRGFAEHVSLALERLERAQQRVPRGLCRRRERRVNVGHQSTGHFLAATARQ